MRHSRNITIFVGFLSACLVQQINSLPQAGRGWSPARPNATSYNNRWQQKFQTTRSPTQNQQPNWQSNGGWSWLIANNSAPQKPQQQQQPQWQQGNGTRRFVDGAAYQSEGERVWLNNNQSHPFIQVPGFGNRPNFAIAKQPNRNNSLATVSNNGFGWRAPQPNYWGPVGTNSSTQNVPTTRQPAGNNGWQRNPSTASTWNIGRPAAYNSTTGGQNAGNWYSPANTPTPPRNAGWATPIKPNINTNWNGVASNGTSGRGGVNSYANWNSPLPGSTLIAGNNNQSAFFSSGPTAPARNNSDSGYSGFAPVGNGGQLPPGSYGASSSYGTPLAPLAGGSSWSSNSSQAGWSYTNGQQQPQARPTNNSNPYVNLFY
ncbi:bifunctional endo-1,4-beta-xylanase XylA-like [Rhagoletis pomonella]|uniref:bifunctional endo-1,4-beta-xylanase XylA-like n=1 Tax=Rhagoletis pomonella TaxID=28610 RepID=UPI001785FCDB|nr:bifunctional endo-1,4-beta-xylanase XylA-like [Rhagoletis pomonella]